MSYRKGARDLWRPPAELEAIARGDPDPDGPHIVRELAPHGITDTRQALDTVAVGAVVEVEDICTDPVDSTVVGVYSQSGPNALEVFAEGVETGPNV